MTRRYFSTDFKRDAACLVLDKDYSVSEACEAMGVGPTALRRWVEQLRAERSGKTPEKSKAMTVDQQRIQELEATIRRIEREKEILKKATALSLGVGQGKGKVILQTFEKNSLELLEKEMPQVPKILLLWVGEGSIEPKSKVTFAESGEKDKNVFYGKQEPKSEAEFKQWVDYAKAQGAIGTGPSAKLTKGGDQSYSDLVQPWMNKYTHDQGLLVHVYTVDEPVDFEKVMAAGVDGIFTNRASELLKFYKRPAAGSVDQVLKNNGF